MKKIKILSLFWHNIVPDSINPEHIGGLNLPVSLFREQIEYIVSNYTPISIMDFMRSMEDESLLHSYAKPPVLLGFDDGFKNVIDYGLPVLKEFGTPALFFVIGEILRNPDFIPWYVEVRHLLRKSVRKTIFHNNIEINLESREGHRMFIKNLFSPSFKSCREEEERQRCLADIANVLNVERPALWSDLDDDLRFVRREDLSGRVDSLLTIGSHAMTHRNLASLTKEEQVYELEQSHLLLRKHCPSYYPTISYPDGSFNDSSISIVKRIYSSAFAVSPSASYRNLYSYPRHCVDDISVKKLKYVLSPFRLNYLLPIKKNLHYLGLRRI
jgi:peptidoglycan/xylan/chitin deacetylase (PgdA/CDA1 family)